MASRIGQPSVRGASFEDFEAYEAAIRGWTPVLHRLDRGSFRGRLVQVSLGPVQVLHTRLDAALEISGTAWPGFQSFGLPVPASAPAVWCGSPTSSRTVSVYERSGDFDAVTRPGFETVVLSIHPEHLAEVGARLGGASSVDALPSGRVVACELARMREVHRLIRQILQSVAEDAGLADASGLRHALEEELPARILQALASRNRLPRPVGPHLRQRALRRALEYVAAFPKEPLELKDLCRATGASERTLRRAFTEHVGVAPKSYLSARRLNGVYRDLRSLDAGVRRVNEAAHRWGFWHMGQFAADYRRLFGELPSQTLDRSRRTRGEPAARPNG